MPSLKVEPGHEDTVHYVAMDYYGKRIATASSDYSVKIIGVGNNISQRKAEWSQRTGLGGGMGSPEVWIDNCIMFV